MEENNQTKFRLYKLHAEQDIDVSKLEKELAYLVQREQFISPEQRIYEAVQPETSSDSYGMLHAEKQVKKRHFSRKPKEVTIDAVIMGNEQQFKIVHEYFIRNNITMLLSANVSQATFSFETEATSMFKEYAKAIRSFAPYKNIKMIFEEKEYPADMEFEEFEEERSVIGHYSGEIIDVINLKNLLSERFQGVGLKNRRSVLTFQYNIDKGDLACP